MTSAQSRNGIEQLAAVANNTDTQVLQVLRRQVGQNRVVDLVLAECFLVPFEAKVPQPSSEVHDATRSAPMRTTREIAAKQRS